MTEQAAAVDTNVLVRIITADDRGQAARATAFLNAQASVFIPKTVLLELEWVLRSAYHLERNAIRRAMHALLAIPNAEIEDESAVSDAIDWYERGMDFADALHIASSGRNRKFATFDAALRRKALRIGVSAVAGV